MEAAHERLQDELAEQLLLRLKGASPALFERVVVDLLVKMGYGGSRADAGKAVGGTGDGGIDGIIKEDRLGLDAVYIQAKRWDNASVGSTVVMQFAGALQRHKASKGVFITTSTFTKDAVECANEMGSRIVLIDGEELTNLMIERGVGV
jgi:restriction system protein